MIKLYSNCGKNGKTQSAEDSDMLFLNAPTHGQLGSWKLPALLSAPLRLFDMVHSSVATAASLCAVQEASPGKSKSTCTLMETHSFKLSLSFTPTHTADDLKSACRYSLAEVYPATFNQDNSS